MTTVGNAIYGGLPPVKTVLAGTDGTFDFGILRPGHYYLKIDDEKDSLAESFEVEINGPPNRRNLEIIDNPYTQTAPGDMSSSKE
jgi:hypothetical protein